MDRMDCDFHHAIVEASGNKKLFQAYENCHIQVGGMLSNFSHLAADQPPETTALQHLPLIKAIETRDADEASELAYDHVKISVDKIQECFGIWLTDGQKPLFDQPRWRPAKAKENGEA
jgi:DNA-binding GntR family transcriptional regulator